MERMEQCHTYTSVAGLRSTVNEDDHAPQDEFPIIVADEVQFMREDLVAEEEELFNLWDLNLSSEYVVC